jgi:putative PIN family toxin of toxin-antitoxin system
MRYIQTMLRLTLDTTVLFQSLRNTAGAAGAILRLVLSRRVELLVTYPVFCEYEEVLTRPETLAELRLSRAEVEAILTVLAELAVEQQIRYRIRPNLVDPADDKFIECAFAGGANYLVTSNIRHYRRAEFPLPAEVVTPDQFLKAWRQHHEQT